MERGWGRDGEREGSRVAACSSALSLFFPHTHSKQKIQARLDVLARGRASTASGSGYGLLSVLLVAALAFAVGQALAARFGAVISAAGLGVGSGGWAPAGWGGPGGKGLGAHLDGLAKKASSAWAAAVAKK
jgi:hypothetical protein